MTLGDDPLGKGDANTEALLAVGVAVLYVVVADFLVSKRLEGFDDVHPVVIDCVLCDVERRILAPLVGMFGERKPAVSRFDLLLAGRLVPS